MKSTAADIQRTEPGRRTRTNLLELDPRGMEAFVESLGERRFRATQLLKWIYHHGEADFANMTDLGKSLRARLEEVAEIRPPEILTERKSVDGTVKWLMSVGRGNNAVEVVFIPETRRGTLCVSSQVGCMLNCTFCSTGAQGFSRNLSTSEIIGQVWQAARALGHDRSRNRRITNVVMMGMGEPLLNFDAVVPAMALMRHDLGFGLGNRRVTLSTAGMVPGIDRLREAADVSLAVSLHAPDDELRDEIVPLNRKYPIAQLLEACRRYVQGRPRAKITIEYTMIDGVNDRPQQARALAKLLRDFPAKINLIPFNPFPGTEYRRASDEAIQRFWETLVEAGMTVMVRKTRGDDIDAACGQLMGRVKDRTRRQAEWRDKVERLSA